MRGALLGLLLAACGPSLPTASTIGTCASCHPLQAQELAASRHSTASTSPTFQALRAQAGSNTALCDGCHHPDHSDDGLTCLTCHTAIGNRATENGQLLLDPSGPVQVGDATGLRAPHEVAASGFLRASDLCATCHDVRGPGAFHEQVFESWQRSPAAASGVTCQGCHLSPVPGQAAQRPTTLVATGSTTPRPHASHRFVGLGASSADALALLSTGFQLTLTSDAGAASLEVTNMGQGHHALAGAGLVRELRAVIEAIEADGGASDLAALPLDVILQQDGQPSVDPLTADAWTDLGLDPNASGSLSVPISPGTNLRACLRYAEVRPALSASLGVPPTPEVEGNCVPLTSPAE